MTFAQTMKFKINSKLLPVYKSLLKCKKKEVVAKPPILKLF